MGIGTCFTIYLPEQTGSCNNQRLHKNSEKSYVYGKWELVLIVEDTESVRSALISGMDQLNYNVIQADNGSEALMLLADLGVIPDLVISDVVMPEMGGIELVREMRKRLILTPVLLITGHEIEKEMYHLDVTNVFWQSKPIDLDNLSKIVADLIKRDRSDQ